MPLRRLKGQETRVQILENGEPLFAIDTIKQSNFDFNFEKLQEGYLGETFDRFDEVFNGLDVGLTVHMATADAIDLAFRIRDRAQNRIGGGLRIDLLTTLIFPGGDIRGMAARDIFFEPIPIQFNSRKEFVSLELKGSCSEADRITV